MTLWDMLDKTLYHQKVWIFECNAYDQNFPLFKGAVIGARENTDCVWNYLMCPVDHYECTDGILDIRVRNEHYEERIEGHYIFSDRWGEEKEKRPWRYSAEIDAEKRKEATE